MFYDATVKGSHGLPHDPFKALVSPRPIGWTSTLDHGGRVNLAPYSFFNAVSYDPCIVMFSASGREDDPMKHTRRNAEESGEFVCNVVSDALKEQMRATAAHVARGVDEMAMVGLTPEPSVCVRAPRVKEAPAHLECRYLRTVEFDVLAYRPVARLGYMDYTTVDHVYAMRMPDSKSAPADPGTTLLVGSRYS
jgi:flavin reductase (DIM6/NTAB) family NADH-FMN oxidoreductase RutF